MWYVDSITNCLTDIRSDGESSTIWVVTFAWGPSDRLQAQWKCVRRVSQVIYDGKNFKPIEKRFTGRFSVSLWSLEVDRWKILGFWSLLSEEWEKLKCSCSQLNCECWDKYPKKSQYFSSVNFQTSKWHRKSPSEPFFDRFEVFSITN